MSTSDPGGLAVQDGPPSTDQPDAVDIPHWVPLVGLLIVAAGLAVSSYLTVAHYESASILACPGTHLINCQRVTTSPESRILGIPVAVLGLAFFVVMAAGMLPAAWRAGHPAVRYGRALFALIGVGMVFYLVYTELFTLDALCLWCTAVHVLTVALFTVTVAGTVLAAPTGQR